MRLIKCGVNKYKEKRKERKNDDKRDTYSKDIYFSESTQTAVDV